MYFDSKLYRLCGRCLDSGIRSFLVFCLRYSDNILFLGTYAWGLDLKLLLVAAVSLGYPYGFGVLPVRVVP